MLALLIFETTLVYRVTFGKNPKSQKKKYDK